MTTYIFNNAAPAYDFGPVECGIPGCCAEDDSYDFEPVTVEDKAGLRALEDGTEIEPVVYVNRMFPITLTKDGDVYRWRSGNYPVRTLSIDDFWLYPDALPARVLDVDPDEFEFAPDNAVVGATVRIVADMGSNFGQVGTISRITDASWPYDVALPHLDGAPALFSRDEFEVVEPGAESFERGQYVVVTDAEGMRNDDTDEVVGTLEPRPKYAGGYAAFAVENPFEGNYGVRVEDGFVYTVKAVASYLASELEDDEEIPYEEQFEDTPFEVGEVIYSTDHYEQEFRDAALAHLPGGTLLTVIDREGDEAHARNVVHAIKRDGQWHDAERMVIFDGEDEESDFSSFVRFFAGDLRVDFLPASY